MLTQKTSNVHPRRCLFSNAEITPQKEFSEKIDFSSKPVHSKDFSTYLSNSLSIVSQIFEYLLNLIWHNNSTDCLDLIERHLNADINLIAGGMR